MELFYKVLKPCQLGKHGNVRPGDIVSMDVFEATAFKVMGYLELKDSVPPELEQTAMKLGLQNTMADQRTEEKRKQQARHETEEQEALKKAVAAAAFRRQVKRLAKEALRVKRRQEGRKTKRSLGDWAQAALRRDGKYLTEVYGSRMVDAGAEAPTMSAEEKAALGTTSGGVGGYLVPPQLADPILAASVDFNWFRRAAHVVEMSSASLMYPLLDVTTVQTNGQSPFTGGLTMVFTGENLTRTESEQTFKQLELKAWELSGYATISRPLWEDAKALQSHLNQLLPLSVASAELKAFLTGNGVAQPQGVLGSPATLAVNRESANDVTFADVATMFTKLPPSSIEFANWAASPTTVAKLLRLKDTTTAERAVHVRAGVAETPQRPQLSLLGLPLRVAEPLPAVGTKGDLMLIDPRYYVVGDRLTLEMASSDTPSFLKNQISLRVVRRLDGQPRLDKPITLQDGQTQVSPFVVLN